MKKNNWLQMFIVGLCFVATNVFSAVDDSGIKVKWGYTGDIGPQEWGRLNPAFAACANGKTQSPINISKKSKTTFNSLMIHYQSAPLRIIDDGNTELNIGNARIMTNEGHGIQVNFPQNSLKEAIIFKEKEYRLLQFHIHTPSETTLNGHAFPMEIHFVHQRENGQVAVIAVLVKVGASNSVLQNLIDHFPADHGIEQIIKDDQINPLDLIPKKQDYYNFMGSLTTPPCTEGLQWIVMPNTITATAEQITAFKNAINEANARPVQPLNNRPVYFSSAI